MFHLPRACRRWGCIRRCPWSRVGIRCRESLSEVPQFRAVTAHHDSGNAGPPLVDGVYCVRCGATLGNAQDRRPKASALTGRGMGIRILHVDRPRCSEASSTADPRNLVRTSWTTPVSLFLKDDCRGIVKHFHVGLRRARDLARVVSSPDRRCPGGRALRRRGRGRSLRDIRSDPFSGAEGPARTRS